MALFVLLTRRLEDPLQAVSNVTAVEVLLSVYDLSMFMPSFRHSSGERGKFHDNYYSYVIFCLKASIDL